MLSNMLWLLNLFLNKCSSRIFFLMFNHVVEIEKATDGALFDMFYLSRSSKPQYQRYE